MLPQGCKSSLSRDILSWAGSGGGGHPAAAAANPGFHLGSPHGCPVSPDWAPPPAAHFLTSCPLPINLVIHVLISSMAKCQHQRKIRTLMKRTVLRKYLQDGGTSQRTFVPLVDSKQSTRLSPNKSPTYMPPHIQDDVTLKLQPFRTSSPVLGSAVQGTPGPWHGQVQPGRLYDRRQLGNPRRVHALPPDASPLPAQRPLGLVVPIPTYPFQKRKPIYLKIQHQEGTHYSKKKKKNLETLVYHGWEF